jgi:hypothetical protein
MPTSSQITSMGSGSREVPQQVHRSTLGVPGEIVEQVLDDRHDAGAKFGGAARGEGGRHQPA